MYSMSCDAYTADDHSDRFDSLPESPSLLGDYYSESSNAERGITLSLGDVMSSRGMCEDFKEFEARDEPPALTQELRAHLATTTLHLSESSPMMVFNDLLALLRQAVDARVNKVNRKKCSLKATVILDGFACDLKVKLFRQHQSGIVVEFQRMSGDGATFMNVFHRASAYLQRDASHQGHASDQVAPRSALWRTPHTKDLPLDQVVAPLLDLAAFSGCAQLLAEAASTLAVMASSPMVAAELRKSCALAALANLQREDDFRVDFPTSRLLSCIRG